MAAAISLNALLPNSPTFVYHERKLSAPCSFVWLLFVLVKINVNYLCVVFFSLHTHSANQTSQAYGLVKGILPGVYIVPSEFCRLRPILMTSLTMVFGMLPLMFASGVGANGNISVGVGTVGGMLLGTVTLLFVVPPLFIVFEYLEEHYVRIAPRRNQRLKIEG